MPVSSNQNMSGLNRYQNWWLILLKVLVIYDSQDKIYYKMLYIDAIYKKGKTNKKRIREPNGYFKSSNFLQGYAGSFYFYINRLPNKLFLGVIK